MGVPRVYRKEDERAIASFDFFDLATGIGYKRSYCMDVDGDFVLSQNILYGNIGFSNFTTSIDIDFDSSVALKPFTIKGDFFINIPMTRVRDGTGGSSLMSYTVTVTIRHWDGSTETDLGTDSATESSNMSANQVKHKVHAFKININKRLFKVGDLLRISVIGTAESSEFGTTTLGHDPKSRTFTNFTDSSAITIDTPFDTDL